MKLVIVSNYINHHQIPLANNLYERLSGDFAFIQTMEMEEDRVRMGWMSEVKDIPYLKLFYKDEENCRNLIMDADIVIFGGVEDESYIKPRLNAGRIVIRSSERLYREGQWKSISPRGRRKKWEDHTQYRDKDVYLLCDGAYVASDFNIVKAYPNKKFTWGYFPEIKEKDLSRLFSKKNVTDQNGKRQINLLWSGRFLTLKHPEYALKIARDLRDRGVSFHLDMVGAGDLEESLKKYSAKYTLEDHVTFHGFLNPSEVRDCMDKTDIFLFTSDYREGWGAVLNESMNSGCAIVACAGIGAVPTLIERDYNGLVYRNGDYKGFRDNVFRLCEDEGLRIRLGKNAYNTVWTLWNPATAADRLIIFCENILKGQIKVWGEGPLSYAPDISPRKGYEYTGRKEKTGSRIYVCHTFYHVYVSMLKEFALPEETRGRAHIALSTMSSDFTEHEKRLESVKLFEKIYMLPEKRDSDFPGLMKYKENHGNILIHTINRIIYTKKLARLEEPFMTVDFAKYDNVYVYCDSDPIGFYLNAKHIKYHALEDGLNCLENLDDAHFSNRGHFKLKAFLSSINLIFIQNGYGRYCMDMEINDRTKLEYDCPKYKVVPRSELEDRLSKEEKQMLVKAFIPGADELIEELSAAKGEKCVLILTEPYHFDEETQTRIVGDIISEYCKGMRVVIKPHPRDTIDYRKVYPGCIVINGKFPMEVMNHMDIITFEKSIAIVNMAMYTLKFVKEKINLGPSFWDRYEAPEKHVFK